MAGNQNWGNRAGAVRQGGEGKPGSGRSPQISVGTDSRSGGSTCARRATGSGLQCLTPPQQRPARLSPDKDHVLSAPITGALERGPRRKGQTLAHPREHMALPEPTPAPSPWNLPQRTTPPGVVSPTANTHFLFLSPQTLSPKDGRPAQTAPRAPLPSVPNTNSQRKAPTRSITNVPCISGIVAPCISAGSPGALRSSCHRYSRPGKLSPSAKIPWA